MPSGYAVRMTCETDPESDLWSGGCDRIAADIARRGRPGFVELYRAFVAVHHAAIPSPAATRRFAGATCEPGFDIGKTLQGTRFILSPTLFRRRVLARVGPRRSWTRSMPRPRAADDRARRALLAPLAAGTLANLTEPLVLLCRRVRRLSLWIL